MVMIIMFILVIIMLINHDNLGHLDLADLLWGNFVGGRAHVNLFIDVDTGDDEEYLKPMLIVLMRGDNDYDENESSGKGRSQQEIIARV